MRNLESGLRAFRFRRIGPPDVRGRLPLVLLCLFFLVLAEGMALFGLAGCGAGPSSKLATGGEELQRLALADRRTFDASRPPTEASPQRAVSFRTAAEGRAALQKGDLEAAEDLLERALGLDPANPFSYLYLADVRMRRGDLRQALVFLDKAEIHFRGHPYWLGEVCARKGLCWERLGSPAEAGQAYRKALEFDPSNQTSLEGLGRLGDRSGEAQRPETK